MTETNLHKFLKDIGMAYLFNQNCFLVATEVHVNPHGQRLDSPLDKHFIIDVCGIGEKYIPYNPFTERGNNYKYNVVRGIEVKVSRADFKNGFICSGCNYNYLMVPEALVWSCEVPKEVGIIKVDVKKFSVTFEPAPTYRFNFKGVRIVRKPTFKKIEQYQIDNALSSIARRSSRELITRVAKNLAVYGVKRMPRKKGTTKHSKSHPGRDVRRAWGKSLAF